MTKLVLPAEVVASFRLQKPVALLNANIGKLQFDIFEEIGVPDSSVLFLLLLMHILCLPQHEHALIECFNSIR